MKLPLRNLNTWRSAGLFSVCLILISCGLFPKLVESISATATAPNPPTNATALASGSAGSTSMPAPEMSETTGPYSLTISNSYPLPLANGVLGLSITASPGKVWLGTGNGTIEQVDSQSGAFVQSIPLITGEGLGYYLVPTLEFNGQYIAALEVTRDLKSLNLFAVEPGSGKVVHQWDMQSPEWSEESRMFTSTVLGVSPGKIWVDGHVIDTQIFDVKKVSMLPMTRFGYNGKGWMWITGDSGGSCDDLIFVNTDDLSEVICQPRLPFLVEPNHVYPDVSIMALAGDRMWMVTGGEGGGQPLTITAYPADMDQLMKEMKPLAKVTLMDESHQIKMLYAGNYLWLLWMGGDKRGFLYQLDPQTGATINSLDLVGDQGRAKGDIPHDFATEGDNLWILTTFQLLRVKLL
jgi:hypothetical protein